MGSGKDYEVRVDTTLLDIFTLCHDEKQIARGAQLVNGAARLTDQLSSRGRARHDPQ